MVSESTYKLPMNITKTLNAYLYTTSVCSIDCRPNRGPLELGIHTHFRHVCSLYVPIWMPVMNFKTSFTILLVHREPWPYILDRFRAIASSTAFNCLRSSSRRETDFLVGAPLIGDVAARFLAISENNYFVNSYFL